MGTTPRYKVHTRYGWFSLDEGSYRDYLAGKLTWIDWPPVHKTRKTEVQAALPPDISERAVRLRDRADKEGMLSVLQEFPTNTPTPSPYTHQMNTTRIDELNLSVRSCNGLMRAGVDTFGKLNTLIKSQDGIAGVRNLGAKSVKEIQTTFFEGCYEKLHPYEKAAYWQSVLDSDKEEF